MTHHGSRGLGAQLYKRGMAAARKHAAIHAPKVAADNAWIKASSEDGRAYWETVRLWTRANHCAIHDLAAATIGNVIADRFWNEHSFVFRKTDGLFYHGKGATPNWMGFSEDDDGRTIVPLNMAEPVLVLKHREGTRLALRRTEPVAMSNARRSCARTGPSCRPALMPASIVASQNATSVRSPIEKYGLCEVIDEVIPYGSIMAGDWQADAPWRKTE